MIDVKKALSTSPYHRHSKVILIESHENLDFQVTYCGTCGKKLKKELIAISTSHATSSQGDSLTLNNILRAHEALTADQMAQRIIEHYSEPSAVIGY